jgi:hypothetical protein
MALQMVAKMEHSEAETLVELKVALTAQLMAYLRAESRVVSKVSLRAGPMVVSMVG